ncbi:MAG: phosphohistidine phosphatase SixA [bacterium]
MKLYLVQHGQAKSKELDPERSLTEKGVTDTEKSVQWLVKINESVEKIIHSGKKRAEQTAQIFASFLNPSQGLISSTDLNPLDDVRIIAQQLDTEPDSLMIVGHLPYLTKLASYLLTGDDQLQLVNFQNSGVVCLIRQENRWFLNWAMIPENLSS